jgi:hypothetical protein
VAVVPSQSNALQFPLSDIPNSLEAELLSGSLESLIGRTGGFWQELVDLMSTTGSRYEPFDGQLSEQQKEVINEIMRYLPPRQRSTLLSRIYGSGSSRTPVDDTDVNEMLGMRTLDINTLRELWNYVETAPASILDSSNLTDCQKDYSSFVEPVTTRIWKSAIIPALCKALSLRPPLCDAITNKLPDRKMPPGGAKMIDAMAKIPTGLLDGKLAWTGAYDMCESHHVDYLYNYSNVAENRSYDGRYCRLDIEFKPGVPPLQFGVCVPNTCSSKEVIQYITSDNEFLWALLKVFNWTVPFAYCGMFVDGSTDPSYQAAMAITIVSLCLLILATLYDGFLRKFILRNHVHEMACSVEAMTKNTRAENLESVKKMNKIGIVERLELLFVAFSGYSNSRRIFTMHQKDGHLPVLNGIRFLSYAYTIWGQSYVWGPLYTETFLTDNLLGAILTLPKEWTFMPVINFPLVADSFLLISGILVTYWFLKRAESHKTSTLKAALYFIIHRYWRLMPVLMLSIMLISTTYEYTADGPLYPAVDVDSENCQVNWWVNLLMLNNIVKVHEQCFGHAWFVSLAFQLYLASLVVVVPLLIRPTIGYIMLAVMYAAHIGAAAGVSATTRESGDFDTWYNGYFITPWCRAGPFLIGLAYGILLYKKPKGVKLNTFVVLLLWLVALACIAAPTFAPYDQYREGGTMWNTAGHVVYDTLARSSWGLGLGWIVVACTWGYGGVINTLLSWNLFLPLSRLAYASMVLHAPVMFGWVYTLRAPMYIDPYHQMSVTYSHVIFSMLFGLLIALLWDYPIGIRWEKVITCRTRIEWLRAGRHLRRQLDLVDKKLHEVSLGRRPSTDTKMHKSDSSRDSSTSRRNSGNIQDNERHYDEVLGEFKRPSASYQEHELELDDVSIEKF